MKGGLHVVLLAILCSGCGLHGPPRQFNGLWHVDLETSRFCPAPASAVQCLGLAHDSERRIWLDLPSAVPAGAKGPSAGPGIYEVAFIGRATLFPGHYGHLGMSGEEIVGDRLIAIRKMKPRFSDAEIQKDHAADPGMKNECLKIIQWGGPEALTRPQEECYKFDPPRRWRGLWFGEFETSLFCPEPARKCPDDHSTEKIWLEVGPTAHLPQIPRNEKALDSLFAVDFVGRKTSYRGEYGHMGGYQQEIVMDRLISIKRLPVPTG